VSVRPIASLPEVFRPRFLGAGRPISELSEPAVRACEQRLSRLDPQLMHSGLRTHREGATATHFGSVRLVGTQKLFCPASPTRRYAGVPSGIKTEMRRTRALTEEQWKLLDPLIPKPRRQRDGRGRPWRSRRSVLNGILWVLRTGGPWADLPDQYPSVPDLPQTLSVLGSLRRDNKNHDCACLSTHCHRGN